MEIIWVAWFFGGLVMGFACCHWAYMGTEDDDGTDKEQSDGYSNADCHTVSGYRSRSGYYRLNKQEGKVMKEIMIYDDDAERIDELCDNNEVTPAEVIELLMDYFEDVKLDNNLI